jgi:prolipoprotein diacylglyceryl transferase
VTLADFPSPTTSVWRIPFPGDFSLPLRAYALCIIAGIVVAAVVCDRRMRHRGVPEGFIYDMSIWAIICGILGARIYHVLTTPELYFGRDGHSGDIVKIWNGGLGIWGAVLGGAFGVWVACRMRKISFGLVADSLAPGLVLAQGIGRWGNYFNNELYGKHTDLPWALKVYRFVDGKAVRGADGQPEVVAGGPFHPTFLYESLWDIGVAVLVILADRRYKFGRGRAFALYVMAYTVGRFWIEALRIDEAHHFLGLRLNDWTSIIVFIGALAYFLLVKGPRQVMVTGPGGELIPSTIAEHPEADTSSSGRDASRAAQPEADEAAGEADRPADGSGEPASGDQARSGPDPAGDEAARR